ALDFGLSASTCKGFPVDLDRGPYRRLAVVAGYCSRHPAKAMPARNDPSMPKPSYDARSIRALVALAVGGFAIGTGEFVIMGLLPNVARDIGVSIPDAGDLISAYALGVTIGAPALAVLVAGWPRRTLLMALAALYALTNFATAL